MSSPLVVGIVGQGFGRQVQLPAFESLPGISVKLSGCRKRQDWLPLASDPGIDVISVAAPPFLHREIVITALEHGKHVLCEKPFGLNLGDGKAMMERSSRLDLVTAVDLEFRYDPPFVALKRELDEGRIGQLESISVSWLTKGRSNPDLPWSWQYDRSLGGGILGAFGSHVIDYVSWLSGKELRLSQAVKRILVPERHGRAVTAEDYCEFQGTLVAKREIPVKVAVSNCVSSSFGHRVELSGSAGVLVLHLRPPFDEGSIQLHFNSPGGESIQIPLNWPTLGGDLPSLVKPFRALAADFIEGIRERRSMEGLPSFADGLRVRRQLDALNQL